MATLLSPIGSYYNESNRSSYIGTSYLLSVCCFTPLYGAHPATRSLRAAPARAVPDSRAFQAVCQISSAARARCFSRSPSSVRCLRLSRYRSPNPRFRAPGSGTLLCGLAPSMDALIAARAIAGMGGGG